MDPSIMKLLEDDEDESMHSGADVEAFTAALNRDIGGDPSTISQPSDPDAVGVLSLGSSSASHQFPGQWQPSTQDENIGQQQKEQQLHLKSSEQQSSQGSGAKDQVQHIGSQPERDQLLLQAEQTHSDYQQLQIETNPPQYVEKDQPKIPEQNLVQSSKLDRPQHSDSQQQHTMQQLNTQQSPAANDANNSMRQMRASPSIPFHMLIPILRPHLDKDRSMQLQAVFTKLRSNEVSKEDFLRVIKNIVGDQMLRQAALKVQLQMQAEAARNPQTNPNQYSLQTQASQKLLSHGAQNFTEPHTFPPHHPTSSQNQKGHKSPPHQPHVPVSTFQMQIDTSFSTLENNSQKSREMEKKPDGKGMHAAQMYSTHMNMVNPERETSMISLQASSKQQHAQLPQTSFSMYGNTAGSFHAHAYPRPSVSAAATSLRPPTQNSMMRQAPQTQSMGSTHLGATQPMGVMNGPKYDIQNSANETKRLHGGNPVAWQPLANKEQNSAFPSMAYVKQEVVDHAVEPSQKFQFTATEGSSFGSVHIEQGNPTLGSLKDDRLEKQSSRMGLSTSTSTTGTNQIPRPVATQTDQIVQVSSATPSLLAGTPMRTPPKKPSVGQKKPSEALGTSSPLPSKKQKTSGAFLDQSIEQLNDVTAVSGVNLREEEEQLLSAPKEESRASEATRRVVQEEEERLILHKAPLQKKLADIMSKCGLESISSDVERCLSMCVEERLRGLLSYLIRLSKQRVDIEKTRHRFVITSDVRRQILVMNRKAKEEWDKKQAEETEKLRKLNESEGNTGVDADKDEGRSKAVKANKEEDDKMRATAANVAARAAVGGDDMLSKWQLMAEQARQKREGHDGGASSSQPSKPMNRKTMPSFRRGSREQHEGEKKGPSNVSGNEGMRRLGRNPGMVGHPRVACNISVKDVIAVLEREPQMSKSTLIYRLYERTAGDSAAE